MSTGEDPRQPTEEELRAAYEAEIKRVRVEHVLLEHIVTLVNLGRRRTGLAPGTEDERDPGQVRLAIESIRALMPLVEQSAPEQLGAIREALAQLQLAFVKIGGRQPSEGAERASATGAGETGPADAPAGEDAKPTSESPRPKPGEPGPAQRSGRLWVPGQ